MRSNRRPGEVSEPAGIHQLPAVLEDLASSGTLTAFQARWLAEQWDQLPDDWSRHPFCHQLGEHTCALIDGLAIRSAGEAR
jgi:hypothetical protein